MKLFTITEFMGQIADYLQGAKEDLSTIEESVSEIITDVRKNGDSALRKYAQQFDMKDFNGESFKVTKEEIAEAYSAITEKELEVLKFAAENIKRFHQKQMRAAWETSFTEGVTVGQLIKPFNSIGVYVPGGKAIYSSSVLMCSLPAKIAGVKKVQLCTPVKGKETIAPSVVVAADIADVDAIYKVGGVQAIAALSYGTESIPKTEKIIGPGNKYVTAAKMQVNKDIAIDLPAGPSEILLIADDTANPCYLAADLLAQAEHDENAIAILITPSRELALKVKIEIQKQLQKLSCKQRIERTLLKQGAIIVAETLEEIITLTNEIAPEHLSIQTANPSVFLETIQNAGAIFLGTKTPVAFGDYTAGLNHVLPTAGYAKWYSGLSCQDFYKTINYMQCTDTGFSNLQKATIAFAEMEGLEAHAKSVAIRTRGD